VTDDPDTVRVLTVDDQAVFRQAAHELVAGTPGFAPIGEAECGASALSAVAALCPDLVLLDVRMPGMNGVETARRIRASHPDVVVVLVSAEEMQDLPEEVRTCGAAACLRKQDLAPKRLVRLWSAHVTSMG
jgi:two-component system, NarL family, invasion response regulator UvrY